MKKGFTLVELSIVLVIIGLLIGGILVGQSLIESSKLNASIKMLSAYDIVTNQFKLKYKALPGDYAGFSGGNNDGQIIASVEWQNVWPNLSIGVGLKNAYGKDFIAVSNDYTNVNKDQRVMPRLKFSEYIDTDSVPILSLHYYNSLPRRHVFTYRTPYRQWGNTVQYDPLSAKDVMALDSKIDDGAPSTGKLLGFTYGALTPAQCYVGSAYNVAVDGFLCSFYLDLGAIVGKQ